MIREEEGMVVQPRLSLHIIGDIIIMQGDLIEQTAITIMIMYTPPLLCDIGKRTEHESQCSEETRNYI